MTAATRRGTVVLCMDEKSQIHALGRTQPSVLFHSVTDPLGTEDR